MPIYDYVCSACHRLTEVVHGIAAEGPHFCPECGAEGTMTKVFSAPSVHFKGSGWAKKDRGSSARATARSKEGAGATDGGSDSATSTDRAGSSGGDSTTADTKSAPPKKGEGSGTSSSSSGSSSGSGSSSNSGLRLRLDLRRLTTMAGSASDWITLAEAAELLAAANVRFRRETIGGWARNGKLQSIKIGGRRFVRRGEVRALLTPPRRVRAGDLQPGLFEDVTG